MRLTLRQMEIFFAIAHSGSTIAAARDLSLSQSATSAALLELERMLGAPLFDRVGKALRLNAEGRSLLPQARQLIRDARAIEQAWDGGAPTSLRLAASTTIGNYVLPPLLAGYAKTLPEAMREAFFESRVQVSNTADVARAVAAGDVDAGFIEGPCPEPRLTMRPWIEDELVIVASARDALSRNANRVGVRALRQARWLLREPGSGTREAVEHALMPHLGTLVPGMQFGSSEAIRSAVVAGLGVACLSRWVVQDLVSRRELVQLHPTWSRMRRSFHIITSGRRLSPALALFLSHCST